MSFTMLLILSSKRPISLNFRCTATYRILTHSNVFYGDIPYTYQYVHLFYDYQRLEFYLCVTLHPNLGNDFKD